MTQPIGPRARLEFMAKVDPLTGLVNRLGLEVALDAAREQAKQTGDPVSLLLLDLDHFKVINNSLGYPTGDLVLQRMAKCLVKTVRPQDTVARLGGDEFVVVCPRTELSEAVEIAERIVVQVAETIRQGPSAETSTRLHFREGPVGVSIGVSSGGPTTDTASLLLEADRRMYHAKAEGCNRVVWQGK